MKTRHPLKKIALIASLISIASGVTYSTPSMAADACWILSYAYNSPGPIDGQNTQPQTPYSGIASTNIRRTGNKNPPTWTETINMARVNAMQNKLIDQRGTVTPIALSTLSCEENPQLQNH